MAALAVMKEQPVPGGHSKDCAWGNYCVNHVFLGKGRHGMGVAPEPSWGMGGRQDDWGREGPGSEAGLGLCPAAAPWPAEAQPCPAVPRLGRLVNFIV
jgi:hypothetical protein